MEEEEEKEAEEKEEEEEAGVIERGQVLEWWSDERR